MYRKRTGEAHREYRREAGGEQVDQQLLDDAAILPGELAVEPEEQRGQAQAAALQGEQGVSPFRASGVLIEPCATQDEETKIWTYLGSPANVHAASRLQAFTRNSSVKVQHAFLLEEGSVDLVGNVNASVALSFITKMQPTFKPRTSA